MKHSAKLFTALAALALFAVVMVGIQDRGADAQSGGTTGRVYLTNLNSCLTTQPNPPSNLACGDSGRVFVGSGTSLFTTVVEKESEAPHDVLNSIARNSDVLIVTVMDSDANISTTGSLNTTVNFGPAVSTVIPVPAEKQPITSSIGEVKLLKADGTVEDSAIVSQVQPGFIVTIGTTQDADSSGLVTVEWQYSGVNPLPVEVYSLTDTADYRVALTLEETGPSTGVFEGEIKLTANVVINDDDSPGSPGDASADPPVQAQLKVNSTSRVTVKYSDALDTSGNTDTVVTDSAQVETTPPQATVSEPADGLNTQTRQQAFRGNVTDDRSGIDISSIMLIIDQGDDADNNIQVVTGGIGDGGYSPASTAKRYPPRPRRKPG